MANQSSRVALALESFASLMDYIGRLDEAELVEALDFELATRRRPTVTRRLISRLVALEGHRRKQELQRIYLWPHTLPPESGEKPPRKR